MKKLLSLFLVFLLSYPVHIVGQEMPFTHRSLTERDMLLSTLQYGQVEVEEDTIVFEYEKSPSKALAFSAVIPGAGQFYSGAIWEGALFLGLEAAFWGGRFYYKSKGEDLEDEYIEFADEKWDIAKWFEACGTHEYNMLENSHHIYVVCNGQQYIVNDSLPGNLPNYIELAHSGLLQPIKNRDFYENIGKYDQFSGGWEDFSDYNPNPDTLIVTPLRDNYLTKRYDSNQALKAASKFFTAVMFNHLISAFHAQIAAKHYSSESEEKYSWQIGLLTDYRYKNPLRGLIFSVNF
jgi:hypothetical protein